MTPLKSIIHFEKAASSQDIIKENIPKYLNTIVHVNHQTTGYGTFKKSWISNENDLTFSYLIKDDIPLRNALINQSLILYQTIKKYDEEIFIKPPNDIYTRKGKLSGLLIEKIILGNDIYWACGIGINRTPKLDTDFVSANLSKGPKKLKLLKEFLKNYNGFNGYENATQIYLDLISKTPLIAEYENLQSKILKIDENFLVHTDHFIKPVEWVTFYFDFK